MCFGPTWHGLVGDPAYFAFLNGVSLKTIYAGNNAGIPLALHFIYQMMFAIISPTLITGAFVNRVNFTAYLLFLTAWLILVYFPFVQLSGGTRFILGQCIAVVASAVWAFAFTMRRLWLINRVASIRVDAETEKLGLN